MDGAIWFVLPTPPLQNHLQVSLLVLQHLCVGLQETEIMLVQLLVQKSIMICTTTMLYFLFIPQSCHDPLYQCSALPVSKWHTMLANWYFFRNIFKVLFIIRKYKMSHNFKFKIKSKTIPYLTFGYIQCIYLVNK